MLFGASYRKSLTTLFPRFLKAMAAYHQADIRDYFKDAFGYDGGIEESAELGVDMYFDGTADEEHICQISVDSALPMDERISMIKESMRHCD